MNFFDDLFFKKSVAAAPAVIKKKLQTLELTDRLEAFLTDQQKKNESCMLSEEIDFGAFSEYIRTVFLKNCEHYLTGTSKERERARNSIILKAKTIANPKTERAANKVVKMTSDALGIVKHFDAKRLSRSEQRLISTFEDRVEEVLRNQADSIVERINEKSVQSANEGSPEHIARLIREGKISEAVQEESAHKSILHTGHPLFPNYGLELKQIDGKKEFVSVPLTAEASKRYPASVKGECTISVEGERPPSDVDIFSYAYNHQKKLWFQPTTATSYLGDMVDPFQAEAAAFQRKTFEIFPPPFPDAIPCKIVLNGKVIMEYVRLRAQEYFENGTLHISNKDDPAAPVLIEIQMSVTANINITLTRVGSSHKDLLGFEIILKNFCAGGLIDIVNLENGAIVGQGKLDKTAFECGGFATVDEKIQFLQDIIKIEEYLGKGLNVPNAITQKDADAVRYVAELLDGKQCRRRFTEAEFSFDVNDQLRDRISATQDKEMTCTYVGDLLCPIFGTDIIIQIARIHEPVVIDRLDKLKEKIKVLDNGDDIKVRFKAPKGVDSHFTDMLLSTERTDTHESSLFVQ